MKLHYSGGPEKNIRSNNCVIDIKRNKGKKAYLINVVCSEGMKGCDRRMAIF